MFESLFRRQDKEEGGVRQPANDSEAVPVEPVDMSEAGRVPEHTNVYTGDVAEAVKGAESLSLAEDDDGVDPYNNQKAA